MQCSPLMINSQLLGGRHPTSRHVAYQSLTRRTVRTAALKRKAMPLSLKDHQTPRQLRGHDSCGPTPWEGVVDWENAKVDDNLRDILVTYGELVQAAYDNLNTDSNRLYACGLPKFDTASMLTFSIPPQPDKPTTADKYKVVKFFFANNIYSPKKINVWNGASSFLAQFVINQLFKAPRTEPNRPVWLGYVALSQGRESDTLQANEAKDVAVVFRGTVFEEEWKLNINGDWMVNWGNKKLGSTSKMRVHEGFYQLYTNKLDWTTAQLMALSKQTSDTEKEWPKTLLETERQLKDVIWKGERSLARALNPLLDPPKACDLETEERRNSVKEEVAKLGADTTSAPYEVIERELKELLTNNDVATITTTGHSLGAALATISALHIAEHLETEFPKWLKENPKMKTQMMPSVTGFPFASPRVGGLAMLKRVEEHPNLRILRVTNARDLVPQVPGFFRLLLTIFFGPDLRRFVCHFFRLLAILILGRDLLRLIFGPDLVKIFRAEGCHRGGEQGAPDGQWPLNLSTIPLRSLIMQSFWQGLSGMPWDYFHVGQMLLVDSGCKSVKQTIRPLGPFDFGPKHNNEVYLHLISAQWGGKPAHDARQPALMNKSDNVVAPGLQVPVNWWARNIATMKYDRATGKWEGQDLVNHCYHLFCR